MRAAILKEAGITPCRSPRPVCALHPFVHGMMGTTRTASSKKPPRTRDGGFKVQVLFSQGISAESMEAARRKSIHVEVVYICNRRVCFLA